MPAGELDTEPQGLDYYTKCCFSAGKHFDVDKVFQDCVGPSERTAEKKTEQALEKRGMGLRLRSCGLFEKLISWPPTARQGYCTIILVLLVEEGWYH